MIRRLDLKSYLSTLEIKTMHSSAIFQAPPISVVFYCPCDNFYHKQKVSFLLYLLGQIVTYQYNSKPLDPVAELSIEINLQYFKYLDLFVCWVDLLVDLID